jgi:hypothetical protein
MNATTVQPHKMPSKYAAIASMAKELVILHVPKLTVVAPVF